MFTQKSLLDEVAERVDLTPDARAALARVFGESNFFSTALEKIEFVNYLNGFNGAVIDFESPEDVRAAFARQGVSISKKEAVEYFNALRNPNEQEPAFFTGKNAEQHNKKLRKELDEERDNILKPFTKEEILEMVEAEGGDQSAALKVKDIIKQEMDCRRKAFDEKPYRLGLGNYNAADIVHLSTREWNALSDNMVASLIGEVLSDE
jgi:hypothetical protein